MKKVNNKLYPVDKTYIVTALLVITIITLALLHIDIPEKTEAENVYTKTVETSVPVTTVEEVLLESEPESIIEQTYEEPEIVEPIVEETPMVSMPATDAEIELLALVTMAEAEGESVEGKRLVIDTVLNRVDSPRWPNTISEVIYQPNQFVAMSNGRAERCVVTDEVRQLVREELLSRTNTEVVYFTAGGYGRYGIPVFQVGNHYFCK